MNLYNTGMCGLFKEIEGLVGNLTGISDRIGFERTRPILYDMHKKNTYEGGTPNYDPLTHGKDTPVAAVIQSL
ncbi:MAG: hypothetical protein ACP5NK_01425 [Thermoplasmata archaeon]